jgi:Flp pilus assembly protein TadG
MLRYLRRDKGQDLVEYALIFPLFSLLLLGIMEFGLVMLSYDSIANAAREGARYGIIHPSDYAGIEAAARRSTIGLNQAALQFAVSQPIGNIIQVEADYDHNLITGLIIGAVGGRGTLHLHTLATMQIE